MGLAEQAAQEKIIGNNLSTDDNGKRLLQLFMKIGEEEKDNVEMNNQDWKEMYEEFNALQATKTNKIPRTTFEQRYSIFFNPENQNTFGKRSATAQEWKARSEEFLHLIDPYRPFQVVDDNNPDIVYKTFPPIFREIDTLNRPVDSTNKNVPNMVDENGNKVDTAYLCNVVNNIFDKYGHHQMENYRREGAKILNQCIVGSQDQKRVLEDVENTNVILRHFNNNTVNTEVNKDTEELSAEDAGISFE